MCAWEGLKCLHFPLLGNQKSMTKDFVHLWSLDWDFFTLPMSIVFFTHVCVFSYLFTILLFKNLSGTGISSLRSRFYIPKGGLENKAENKVLYFQFLLRHLQLETVVKLLVNWETSDYYG